MRSLVLLVLVAASSAYALAPCGNAPGDDQMVAAARAAVDATCNCAGVATHAEYVRCAADVARARVEANELRPQCRGAVRRCAAKSTCGKPGAVACCRVRNGVPRCSIQRDATRCGARGGTVDPATSCCDACGAATTTTATTTSSTSTTSRGFCESSGAPACPGMCPGGGTCMPFTEFCFCVNNFCSGGSYPTCDGSCPAGSFCFTDNFNCQCISETCTGSQCLCLPPRYGFGTCPPGHTQAFCNESQVFFCHAGPCANASECPAGDACIDVSSCN